MKIELVVRKVSAHSLTTCEYVLAVGMFSVRSWDKDVNMTFMCILCSTSLGFSSLVYILARAKWSNELVCTIIRGFFL